MHALYPAIGVRDVAVSRDFYASLLGFRVVFDSGWYVQLRSPAEEHQQLGLVRWDHPSIPEGFRLAPQGVLVSVETDDPDAVHERARALGLDIVLPLRDEAFGQRHFMTVDPDGVLVDVIKVIPTAPGYDAFVR